MTNEQKSPLEMIEWEWLPYPEQALNEILANKEQYLPQIRAILQRVVDEPDYFVEEEEYNGHLFAVYLLSQWRDTDSCQLIIKAFSGEVKETWNDVLHEIGRFITSVFDGDLRKVVEFIKDSRVNEYVRMNAFGALIGLYFKEQLTREQVIDIAREIIRDCSSPENSAFLSGFVCECCDLYCPELIDDIRKLFDDDLIDTDWISIEDFEGDQKDRQRETEARSSILHQPIDDIHEEIQNWAMFSEKESNSDNLAQSQLYESAETRTYSSPKALPPVEKYPGTGRNDQCPCGSGQKYKKCCLQ